MPFIHCCLNKYRSQKMSFFSENLQLGRSFSGLKISLQKYPCTCIMFLLLAEHQWSDSIACCHISLFHTREVLELIRRRKHSIRKHKDEIFVLTFHRRANEPVMTVMTFVFFLLFVPPLHGGVMLREAVQTHHDVIKSRALSPCWLCVYTLTLKNILVFCDEVVSYLHNTLVLFWGCLMWHIQGQQLLRGSTNGLTSCCSGHFAKVLHNVVSHNFA